MVVAVNGIAFLVFVALLTQSGCKREKGTLIEFVRPELGTGPLRVNQENCRYFVDGTGKPVYLTGSHTWANFQDSGESDPPARFDYPAYLDFLEKNNHNFFRLWVWEQASWITDTTTWRNEQIEDYWFDPMPYARKGPGLALDGKSKFDLTCFNQAYFDRLRERVLLAGKRGIYVSIMLFNGWSIEGKGLGNATPWRGHPYNQQNNINGINGDLNGDGEGKEAHTLQVGAITALQENYVRKVVDTVNDLDNVLYEISNESPRGSKEWQYHMIEFIHRYEKVLPKKHPVGLTVEYPDGDNVPLFAGPADWISPNAKKGDYLRSPDSDTRGKVIISDTDHLCGVCGDSTWVWKTFLRGLNPAVMDPYDGLASGIGAPRGFKSDDPDRVDIRRNLGYTLGFAGRVNLDAMTPRADLSSSGFCLADTRQERPCYLAFIQAPKPRRWYQFSQRGSLTLDLSLTPTRFKVEWFNPSTGRRIGGQDVTGGTPVSFTAPFPGDAVLFLY